MANIIEVRNISKRYSIGARESYGSLREEIMQALASPFSGRRRGAQAGPEDIWALKDVSFDVEEGEVVGIIGRNGAGKSTLLKILSRITEPTSGTITMRGRVASLLEVGTGFHPELTGRENIFLNGALLGMTAAEIRKRFDEIVAFSEIEKFLDTPVKRYSSGMYVRLAFAVAAHLDPEILIVDEVLAVGDAAFQKKCLGKMGDVARGGRTVLFVSHNMGAVRNLCGKVALISEGCLNAFGRTAEVVSGYLAASMAGGFESGEASWPDASVAPGGEEMRLMSVRATGPDGKPAGRLNAEEPISIEITYRVFKPVVNLCLAVQVVDQEGVVAFTSPDYCLHGEKAMPGIYRSVCIIPGRFLNSGVHVVSVYSDSPGVKIFFNFKECISFRSERRFRHGAFLVDRWLGAVAPDFKWNHVSIG